MKKENKKLPLEEKFELEFKKAEYLNKVLAAIENPKTKKEDLCQEK